MAGLADAARFTIQTFENWSIRADEYREIDSERVPVLVKYSGRGKASGLEVAEIREGGANLFHIRDGTLTRLVVYPNRDRAFADLGLTPEAS